MPEGLFAGLSRLPAKYRFSPSEAEMVLRERLRDNVSIAPFESGTVRQAMASITAAPAAGGASHDAFIVHLLEAAHVDQIVTYHMRDIRRLARGVPVARPSDG